MSLKSFENSDILSIILSYIESNLQLNFSSCNKYLREYFYIKCNILINLSIDNSYRYCNDSNFLIKFNKLILNPNKYFSLNLKINFKLFFEFNEKLKNEKLTSLKICSKDYQDKITNKNIDNLINIEILDFTDLTIYTEDINKLINLKELYLDNCYLFEYFSPWSNNQATKINLKNLRKLCLFDMNYLNDVLNIELLENLEILELNHCEGLNIEINNIIINLKKLHFRDCTFQNSINFNKLPNLETLVLDSPDYDNLDIDLKSNINLKNLYLSDISSITEISNFKKLQKLFLHNCNINKINNLPNLIVLSIITSKKINNFNINNVYNLEKILIDTENININPEIFPKLKIYEKNISKNINSYSFIF